jgi:hypothetical protein
MNIRITSVSASVKDTHTETDGEISCQVFHTSESAAGADLYEDGLAEKTRRYVNTLAVSQRKMVDDG